MGRRLGQHFLARTSILERIADAACGSHTPFVIEIGPGRGALTEFLLQRAEKVVAIEVDPVLVHYLRQRFQPALANGQLELIEGDVLKTDLRSLHPRPVIAGNLPYYITSPILERTFSLSGHWACAVFLVQAEVAARITANPGSRDFGYLSVMVQAQSRPEMMFPVPRAAFRPPPNVESAVVRLTPRNAAGDLGLPDISAFLKFAQLCFHMKRKTLRNNLAPAYGSENVTALPEAKLRAEQMSVEDLAMLYRKLSHV